MYYKIKATGDNRELTFETNDILEVLPRVRELWNQDFKKVQVSDFMGAVHFLYDENAEDDLFMSMEMKLMWVGFFGIGD